MHLLVLSAFRRRGGRSSTGGYAWSLNAPSGAQCFPTSPRRTHSCRRICRLNAPSGAQCFPTSPRRTHSCRRICRLNAPSGAQCFPTGWPQSPREPVSSLNAPSGAQCFPTVTVARNTSYVFVFQCTFWCSVLSDTPGSLMQVTLRGFQCTFWCSVLSDFGQGSYRLTVPEVSMHLLVLSAFRQQRQPDRRRHRHLVSMHLLVLSAFRLPGEPSGWVGHSVSMHLLVLSAFRPSPRMRG